MDFILQFIFELLFDGAIEASQSSRVPKWIRVILLVIIGTFYLFVVTFMIILTYIMFSQKEYTVAAILFALVLFFIIGGFLKVRKALRRRRIF